MSDGAIQRQTFNLIVCERCGHCSEPPTPPKDMPHWLDAATGPLRCTDCGETLMLIEAFLAPETEMWQEKPGAMWKHVAYLDRLPTVTHRQRWVK